jgi:hypothetical protein
VKRDIAMKWADYLEVTGSVGPYSNRITCP